MEEVTWDRNSFVTKQPEPPQRSSLPVLILCGLLLCVGAAGGYYYMRYSGFEMPAIAIPRIGQDPQVAELTARLEEMTARLEQLEKSRPAAPRSAVAPGRATTVAASSAAPAGHRPGDTPPDAPRQRPSPTASPSTSSPLATEAGPNSGVSASPGQSAPNRERWEATANRLVDAVGELGEQRRELTTTREAVEQIQRTFERTRVPFDIRKNSGRQQVGPIWMDLRNVDRSAQRFTMRLFFDDQWVEIKDRVLGERLEFYIREFTNPLELVVSEIRRDQVLGQLGVPVAGTRR